MSWWSGRLTLMAVIPWQGLDSADSVEMAAKAVVRRRGLPTNYLTPQGVNTERVGARGGAASAPAKEWDNEEMDPRFGEITVVESACRPHHIVQGAPSRKSPRCLVWWPFALCGSGTLPAAGGR